MTGPWRSGRPPFTDSEVRADWPYLGAIMAGMSCTAPTSTWSVAAASTVCTGTWKKAIGKLRERSAALAATTCSQGRRAAAWNSYMVSLVPYPSHTAVPGRLEERALTQQFSLAMILTHL